MANLKCFFGLHLKGRNGSLRRTCHRCKAVWYTDYFLSRETGRIMAYKVIGNDGVHLPEMKNWKLHEYDQPHALVEDEPLTIEV